MAGDNQTKICPLCAESIKAAARVCPFCRKAQGRFFFINRYDLMGMLSIGLLLGLAVSVVSYFQQGKTFSPERDKIDVLRSQLTLEVSSDSTNVALFGVLTNRSNHAWKDLGFSVVFRDVSGKLLDADNSGDDFTILPHADHSFHLNFSGRKIMPQYSRYDVVVHDARDPAEWFAPP